MVSFPCCFDGGKVAYNKGEPSCIVKRWCWADFLQPNYPIPDSWVFADAAGRLLPATVSGRSR